MLASLFATVLAAVAVSAQGTTNGILVTTPSQPVFCQPTLLSWSGGTSPYFVNINVGGSISNVLEVLLTSTTATSYTWIADIAPGTAITLAVKDATGASNYAAQVTVQPNPSGVTTCAGASSNVNSASVVNTVSATVSQVSQTTVSQSAAVSSRASSAAAGTSSVASRAAGVTSSAAGAVSSVAAQASSRAGGVVNSASQAVASATQAATGGAIKFGASVVTVGLLAVGSVALFL